MNEEERQRQMDFILNQQAQFAADIQRLGEAQARLGEAQAQTAEAQKRTEDSLGKVVEALTRLAEMTLAGFEEVRQSIASLAAKQLETEDKLNHLIVVVERHISEGHHGQS